jgi:UDP-N-acetylglucosamine--N-acetylmuramyl-(pentapeptide) pyrophosphoryl-undecaprenol N-acetylglucosamine transferase
LSTQPRFLIATGGSGGHLYPAFAVAEELERQWPAAEVQFTTGAREIERGICTSAGRAATELLLLPTGEARRQPIAFATAFVRAMRDARRLISKFQPSCVIGTGGFVMAPVVREAARARVPIVLLEQNAVAGRATRWFARQASAVCATFSVSVQSLRARRVEVTGNPVRRDIADLFIRSLELAESPVRSVAANPPLQSLLVLGGSQGAKGLNDALEWIAVHQPALLAGRTILHQTGSVDSARQLQAVYEASGIAARVVPFFDDMASVYRSAGVVISRAGATTLAELACAGLPAILVPYPYARDRHQQANAEAYSRTGAAMVVQQRSNAEGTGRELARMVKSLTAGNLAEMSAAVRQLARPDAATKVVEIIDAVVAGSVQ